MGDNAVIDAVERQEWLTPIEEGLQGAVNKAYEAAGPASRPLKNFMHGVWLGHPLHPILTDIPLGIWPVTAVLDLMEAAGHKNYAPAADFTLKAGLVGAAGAALTGLTEWRATDGPARRVGVTHGLLNLTSIGLYAASLAARNQGKRTAGRTLAFLGFAISSCAAWLGGNLVYGKQIGVNHTAAEPMPEDWTPVLADSELREGEPTRADANGVRVLLVRRTGQIYAIAEVCSHLAGPLAEGNLQGDTIECPWHGSRFCIRDGSVIDAPATHPQPRFETRVRDGQIEVRGWSQE